MTDHIVDINKKVLSPGAQRVLGAATLASWKDYEPAPSIIAAAAFRALADQVVPEQPAIPAGDLTEQTYRWDERSGIRAHILAIATELEGTND